MSKKPALHNVLADKPDLVIYPADRTVTAYALVAALAKFSFNLYAHQSKPVIVVLTDEGKAPTLWPINRHGMIIAAHKIVQPIRREDGKRIEVTLPLGIADLCLQVPPATWPLRPLTAFSSGPLLRDNGSINCQPGYDDETCVFTYDLPNLEVPEAPSVDDAKSALATLRHAFRTFAFADRITTKETFSIDGKNVEVDVVNLAKDPGRDESAAMVALLTAVCRPSLLYAPAVICRSSPHSGSGVGKGLLINAMCVIAYGHQPLKAPFGRGDEFDKGLVAALIRSDSCILVDNVNDRKLQSQVLCTALTDRPALVRVLGVSELREANPRAFISVTGNGLTIAEDLVRRVFTVEFDAQCEDPEQRRFPGNFLDEVGSRRAELLAAALTIWRYGRQNPIQRAKPLGGFEQWCAWVRDPLIALGCQDPVKRIDELKTLDPARRATVEIFQAWWNHHKDTPIKAAELDDAVQELLISNPKQRSRQKVVARVAMLVGTQLGGFRLTCVNREKKGRWGALKYKLEKLATDEHQDQDEDEAEARVEATREAAPNDRNTAPASESAAQAGGADAGDRFDLDQASAPISRGCLQVLGPDLEHACVQCRSKDDEIYLIRDNSSPGTAAQPLHEECAPFFFGIRGTAGIERPPAAVQVEYAPAAAAEDPPIEPPPADPVEHWRKCFARLDPTQNPCPGFRPGEWQRMHGAIRAFLDSSFARQAVDRAWTDLELFGVHRAVGITRRDCCGVLMTNTRGVAITHLTRQVVGFANSLVNARPIAAALSIAVVLWDFHQPAKK